MTRLTANDFHPEVLRLFDQYVHARLTRQEFVAAAAQYAQPGETGESLLEALSPKFAASQQVQPSDPRLHAEFIRVASPQGHGWVRCYRVKPAKVSGKLPGILVAHENRGLNPHIEDIARRLALEGYTTLAPDALSTVGGYPGDEDKARELFKTLDVDKIRADFLAAAQALQGLPDVNGRHGAVGFCFGGGMVNFLATRLPDLRAAVPFYGAAPPAEDVPNIKAPLLIHYAENDERPNARWPAYKQALDAAGLEYEMHLYPGTQHGFNNDTTPRYDAAAAELAWARTLRFFNTHLLDRS
jgi:carboxymethylenebutenolidase